MRTSFLFFLVLGFLNITLSFTYYLFVKYLPLCSLPFVQALHVLLYFCLTFIVFIAFLVFWFSWFFSRKVKNG